MGEPYGFIQWKGTDVCIDVHCECGAREHIDGFFAYHWRCATCGATYRLRDRITLERMSQYESEKLARDDEPVYSAGLRCDTYGR